MRSILSVDVEDWYHILDVKGAPKRSERKSIPSRVGVGLRKIFEILTEYQTGATLFFLRWIAEKFPRPVEVDRYGHEVASHGYSHEPVYRMNLPASRQHGGMNVKGEAPRKVTQEPGTFYELPISVVEILGKPICFLGGGYSRFFPCALIKRMAQKVIRENRPVIFYIQPRELDPEQPHLSMSPVRRFKSYVNVKTTEPKMRKLLKDFKVTTFGDFIRVEPGKEILA